MSTIRQLIIDRLDEKIALLHKAHQRLANRSLEDRRLNLLIHRCQSMRARLHKPPQPKG
jgi:hypothetical protein